MIFPRMDPYLEGSGVWPGVHNAMIVYIRDRLQPHLRPRYIAALEERVFVELPEREFIPDVTVKRNRPVKGGQGAGVLEVDAPVRLQAPGLEVHESYVAILDRQSGQRVVTVIEVVSPSNKYAGTGRESYLAKQREVLASQAHLVEIDLLRGGPHVISVAEWRVHELGDYASLVCVNRAEGLRDMFEVYPRKLRERLPRIRVPLADDDPDVPLDLQAVLDQTYDAGLYRELLRYDAPCVPALSPEDRAWADGLIREAFAANE